MKIDYSQNPLGIVKKFGLLYKDDKELNLELIVYARGEDDSGEVNLFEGEVRSNGRLEVDVLREGQFYQDLTNGAPTLDGIEKKMKIWCDSMGIEIATGTEVTI